MVTATSVPIGAARSAGVGAVVVGVNVVEAGSVVSPVLPLSDAAGADPVLGDDAAAPEVVGPAAEEPAVVLVSPAVLDDEEAARAFPLYRTPVADRSELEGLEP